MIKEWISDTLDARVIVCLEEKLVDVIKFSVAPWSVREVAALLKIIFPLEEIALPFDIKDECIFRKDLIAESYHWRWWQRRWVFKRFDTDEDAK